MSRSAIVAIRRDHLGIHFAQVHEAAIAAFDDRLAVPDQIVGEVQARDPRMPDAHLDLVPALRSAELRREVALRWRIRIVVRVPQAQAQRETPVDAP
jgi:hypothetical protein